ncbi:MAG: sigma-54 dependent transcriptional regulator [Acidobacteriota bacterium]
METMGAGPSRVLVVDDDPTIGEVLSATLADEGYQARACASVEEAMAALAGGSWDLLLTDLRMPGEDGLALLRKARARSGDLPIILMTAYGGVDEAVIAVKAGADDFLQKPILPEVLVARVARVLEASRLRRRVAELETGRFQRTLVCASPAMRAFVDRLPVAARSDCTILLRGETGSGKEMVARAIHEMSPRARGAFTAVNCGGIPEELFEAELFGHLRGAFTGADRDRPGLIAQTDGGTLFLDEIGDLPYGMQVKILRFLEDGEIRPIGGERARKVDARIVAATHVDLETAVAGRGFREDLYYRLNALELFLPPLRERPEDIVLLAERFLGEIARKEGRPEQRLSPGAIEKLKAHPWPGNVRELKNRLRAAALYAGTVIDRNDVDLGAGVRATPRVEAGAPDFRAARQRFERQFIEEALTRCRGNVFKAAGETGISRRQLYDRMKELGVDPDRYRDGDPGARRD